MSLVPPSFPLLPPFPFLFPFVLLRPRQLQLGDLQNILSSMNLPQQQEGEGEITQ